jgi:hypothetical protein
MNMNLKFKLFSGVEPSVIRLSICFLIFLVAFEALCFDIGYFQHIVYLYDSGDSSYFIVSLIYIGIAFYCFFNFLLIALSSDWKYKILYFLLFTLAVFYEYGYQKALRRFSDIFDIEAAIATTFEQKLSSIFLYFNSKYGTKKR